MVTMQIRAEQLVINAILTDPLSIHSIMSSVSADMFNGQDTKLIFSTISEMYMSGEPINLISTYQTLSKVKSLRKADALSSLSQIYSMFSPAEKLELKSAISLLLSETIRNEHIELGKEIKESAESSSYDPTQIIDKIQNHILDNKFKAILNKKEYSNSALLDELDQKMIEASKYEGINGIRTGYDRFDKITSGMQPTNLIIVAARPAMGKELINSSRVYTENGYVAISELKVGDKVLGSNGYACAVTGVFPQGKKDVYRIYFDDSSYVDCGLEHQWEVSTRDTRKSKRDPIVMTTSSMIDDVILADNRKNFSIRMCQKLSFIESDVDVHPYVLGALIGDGSFGGSYVSFSNSEDDVISKVTSLLPVGCQIKHKSRCDYSITGLNSILRDYGLMSKRSDEKFIPKNYLYNSIENRVELLRGLIDTDGFVTSKGRNAIEYSTTSKLLCDDILELVRCLGGKASYKVKSGRYTKNGVRIKTKNYFRMYLSLPNDIIPVSSKKHLAKYSASKKYHSKFITKIERLGYQDDMTCISVDADDCLYVTDGCTLTHNTQFALGIIKSASIRNDKKGLFVSCEMDEVQVMKRIMSVDSGVAGYSIKRGKLQRDEVLKFERSRQRIKDANFKIVAGSFTISDVLSMVYKMKHSEGLDYVIIDYIQKIQSPGAQNRTNEVGDVSRKLKDMANDLKIPVIALAQLSRAVEHRVDKKPILSDLRESGDIEQDADIVTFLYRPGYYMEQEERNTNPMAEDGYAVIAKHRDGDLEDIYLKFKSDIPAWTNPYKDDYAEDTYTQTNLTPNGDFDYQGSQPF